MNYPRGALTTQAEVDAALKKNGKIYCVEPSNHNGCGVGPWVYPYKTPGGGMRDWTYPFAGWNLIGNRNMSFIDDFLFQNFWDAFAYACKVKQRITQK